MADSSRQSRLAAAKKKLKEYQQKNSPGAAAGTKKKRKTKDDCRPETPTGDDQQPPENAYFDSDVATRIAEQLAPNVPVLSNSDSLPNCRSVLSAPGRVQLTQIHEAEDHKNALDENRSLSSTESLRQLSEQLNGLVSQSTSYVNGESAVSSTNIKEMETRYQELAVALDSSNLTNKQLVTKIEELKEQSQEAADQLEKEKKELEKKFSKEQAALREQLQVHIQTIGILVSEKSELQAALAHTQQAARQKSGEVESLAARLRSSRQRVVELERTLASVSLQQKQAEKRNEELLKELEGLKLELYKQSKSSEEIKQQNSELSEKVRCLVSKISVKELDVEDLRKKLEMAELMIQQLSESVHQLQAERDQYVEKLKEEQSIWQQQVQQLSEQVHAMADEKEEHMACGDDDVDS